MVQRAGVSRAVPSERGITLTRYRIAVKIITVSEHPALKAFHRRYMEREREREKEREI